MQYDTNAVTTVIYDTTRKMSTTQSSAQGENIDDSNEYKYERKKGKKWNICAKKWQKPFKQCGWQWNKDLNLQLVPPYWRDQRKKTAITTKKERNK